jgi:hypothetical protein
MITTSTPGGAIRCSSATHKYATIMLGMSLPLEVPILSNNAIGIHGLPNLGNPIIEMAYICHTQKYHGVLVCVLLSDRGLIAQRLYGRSPCSQLASWMTLSIVGPVGLQPPFRGGFSYLNTYQNMTRQGHGGQMGSEIQSNSINYCGLSSLAGLHPPIQHAIQLSAPHTPRATLSPRGACGPRPPPLLPVLATGWTAPHSPRKSR